MPGRRDKTDAALPQSIAETARMLAERSGRVAARRRRRLGWAGNHMTQIIGAIVAAVVVGGPAVVVVARHDQGPRHGAPPPSAFALAVGRAQPLVHLDFTHPSPGLVLGSARTLPGGLLGDRDEALVPSSDGGAVLEPVTALQGPAARTVMLWFRTHDGDPQALLDAGTVDPAGRFLIAVGQHDKVAGVHVQSVRSNVFVRARGLDDGRWHGIAVTLHNRDLRVFVDGRQRNGEVFNGQQTTITPPPFVLPLQPNTGATAVSIGGVGVAGGVWKPLDGSLDELLIFGRALPVDTVRAIMKANPAG